MLNSLIQWHHRAFACSLLKNGILILDVWFSLMVVRVPPLNIVAIALVSKFMALFALGIFLDCKTRLSDIIVSYRLR